MRIPLNGRDTTFVWPKEVEEGLKEFNRKVSLLNSERLEFLREKARERGYTASSLDDLRSSKGTKFIEEIESYPRDLKMAREEDAANIWDAERAYWCGFDGFGSGATEGCGWVLGLPKQSSYNNLGPLSGSAGEEYHCKLCSSYLARDESIVS
jgi:hypothetical protein